MTQRVDTLPWTRRFDFDGDGIPDRIDVKFSGGAHCCYVLAVATSASRAVTQIPFELDGGYPNGLDLSRPAQFDIQVDGQGVARLVMEIATYGGEPQPLPPSWNRQWGVRSHHIAVSLVQGLHAINLGWSCERAATAIAHGLWTAWEGLPAHCSVHALAAALDAVLGEEAPGVLGTERRPVRQRRATRATDDQEILLHVSGDSVVRVDLAGAIAQAVAKALSDTSPRPAAAGWRWWSTGLAIQDGKPGAPARLALLPETDAVTYERRFAWIDLGSSTR